MTSSRRPLHFVVPGSIEQRTGGYLYDARMVTELRAVGYEVVVHELDGSFPMVDEIARSGFRSTLQRLPEGSCVVIDGLAFSALPAEAAEFRETLDMVALVHHPLADETGLDQETRDRLLASEREALASAARVLVTSAFTGRRLHDFGVSPDRIRVVYPGTDPAPLAVGPDAGRAPQLLSVASVTPRKGHDVLVSALSRLTDLEWQCVCAGSLDRDSEFTAGVFEQVERSRLSERIRFVGELGPAALDEAYRHASLFVLPSHYEGYGMAFAEALARGIPVVGTTGGAVVDTVPDGTGILVAPGDAEAFAAALRTVLTDGAVAQRMAEAARAHAAELPTWAGQARVFAEAVGLEQP